MQSSYTTSLLFSSGVELTMHAAGAAGCTRTLDWESLVAAGSSTRSSSRPALELKLVQVLSLVGT